MRVNFIIKCHQLTENICAFFLNPVGTYIHAFVNFAKLCKDAHACWWIFEKFEKVSPKSGIFVFFSLPLIFSLSSLFPFIYCLSLFVAVCFSFCPLSLSRLFLSAFQSVSDPSAGCLFLSLCFPAKCPAKWTVYQNAQIVVLKFWKFCCFSPKKITEHILSKQRHQMGKMFSTLSISDLLQTGDKCRESIKISQAQRIWI